MPALAYVEYDTETGRPKRDGRPRAQGARGEPGLLISPVNRLSPFDGYTDPKASEEAHPQRLQGRRRLVQHRRRDAAPGPGARRVRRPPRATPSGGRARTSPPPRWRPRWPPTRRSRRAPSSAWRSPTPGPGGDGAVKVRDGAEFDGIELAETLYDRLPSYAIPLFIRIVDHLEATSTFKSRKVDLRDGPTATTSRIRCSCWRPPRGLRSHHDAYPARSPRATPPKDRPRAPLCI